LIPIYALSEKCYYEWMKDHIVRAIDARQTSQWARYMESIGWKTETIGSTHLFIKKLPFIDASLMKIQHPQGPFPFERIDEISRKYKTIWTILEPHMLGYEESEFRKYGYRKSRMLQVHTATIKIDLKKSKKDMFNSFSENAKRNIKKAQKQNLEIRTIFMKEKKNWKYFPVFYSLLRNLSKMKKFYIYSYYEYQKRMMAFKDTSVLIFAYENDAPIAVVWYAYFSNVIAYFQTGITKRGYETLANYLLVWEGLKLGKKLKLSVFDFESIYDERFPKNVPQYKKYTEFKKRFHGELILYPTPWIKIYNLWAKLFYLWGTIL